MISIFLWSAAIIIAIYLIYVSCFKLSPQEEEVLDRILIRQEKQEILNKPNLTRYLEATHHLDNKNKHFNAALAEVKKEKARQKKLEALDDKAWFESTSDSSSRSSSSRSSSDCSSSDSGGSSSCNYD